jgi:5'(3')-deoxyribonucleotidase
LTIKPTIAIDVDDVLALSVPHFVEYNNALWGGNVDIEEYTEDWMKLWSITPKQLEEWQADVAKNQKIYPFIKPIKGAKTTLIKLSEKYRLVVLTSRSKCFAEMTEKWLEEHFSGLIQEVHFAGFWDNLSDESAHYTKGKIVSELGAKYLIDDQPKHCFSANECGVKSILFGDYSWNRDVENVHKAHNWTQVRGILCDGSGGDE